MAELKQEHFDTAHLDFLKSVQHSRTDRWDGNDLRTFSKYVEKKARLKNEVSLPKSLNNGRASRKDLFQMVQDDTKTTEDCCIAILGWGGIKYHHCVRALESRSDWLPIAEDLRFSGLDHKEAYAKFAEQRENKSLVGVGPAFFTKLIFFLGVNAETKRRGYIMDQWTARSANLLLGEKFIKLNSGKYVADRNDSAIYAKFCGFIRDLSIELNTTPDEAEERIFSIGNKGRLETRGKWRSYVLANG